MTEREQEKERAVRAARLHLELLGAPADELDDDLVYKWECHWAYRHLEGVKRGARRSRLVVPGDSRTTPTAAYCPCQEAEAARHFGPPSWDAAFAVRSAQLVTLQIPALWHVSESGVVRDYWVAWADCPRCGLRHIAVWPCPPEVPA